MRAPPGSSRRRPLGSTAEAPEHTTSRQFPSSGATVATLQNVEASPSAIAFRLPFRSGKQIYAVTSAPRAFRSKGRPGDRAVLDEAAFVDDLGECLKAALAFLTWAAACGSYPRTTARRRSSTSWPGR